MTCKSLVSVVSLPLMFGLFGCIDASEDGVDEDLGASESALSGPVGCLAPGVVDMLRAANYSAPLNMRGEIGGSMGSTSPSAAYDSAPCSNRYVVEATNTNGKPHMFANAAWASGGLTLGNCQKSWVQESIYGYNASTNTWKTVVDHSVQGELTPNPWAEGDTCTFNTGTSVSSIYSKVRVAARAYTRKLQFNGSGFQWVEEAQTVTGEVAGYF
jgi:hypothetical protein